MSEVLVVYDAAVTGADGRSWTAQACGRVAEDGLWEGWLEFLPQAAETSPVRTGRETGQPNRNDLVYWAQGLTQAYLEGALDRALRRNDVVTAVPDVRTRPVFDRPAKRREWTTPERIPRALLNPFEVYLQGEDVLLDQLAALDAPRLRDIAVAYGFGDVQQTTTMGHAQLTSLIMAGVRTGGSGGVPEADLRHRP